MFILCLLYREAVCEGIVQLLDGLSYVIKDIRIVSLETRDGAVKKLDEV